MMFEAVYVISLDRSMERMADMDRLLPMLGFDSYRRWPAIDGDQLGADAVAAYQAEGSLASDFVSLRRASRGREIGCALSHVLVLRDILAQGHASALILEDDLAISGPINDWRERCASAFADLPEGWELWYLFRCLDVQSRVQRITARTVVPWAPMGCAAYAVTRAGAEKLLAAVTPLDRPIDASIVAKAVRSGKVAAFAASPRLIAPGLHASIIRGETGGDFWTTDGVNRPPEFRPERDLVYGNRGGIEGRRPGDSAAGPASMVRNLARRLRR